MKFGVIISLVAMFFSLLVLIISYINAGFSIASIDKESMSIGFIGMVLSIVMLVVAVLFEKNE